MQRGLALLALAGAVSASEFAAIVEQVNSGSHGWKAAVPSRFNSTEEAKKLCGTWLRSDNKPGYVELPEQTWYTGVKAPASFDARTAFANCSVIRKVRDQSSCGSCWAFGSTETFEDRHCAQKGIDLEMSTEDTASCCSGFACGLSMGCNGGQPGAALNWMTSTGVVTGGDYDEVGTGKSCRPYTLAPCAHHVDSKKYPKCPSSEYPTPRCTKQCEQGYRTEYSGDKRTGARSYSVRGEENIKAALLRGPLSAAFTVYADFPTYKSGVYRHTSGQALGGHAVEIVGYGTEAGQDYWLVKNSWNEEWGDNGFFKILRGQNECGIEGEVSGIDF